MWFCVVTLFPEMVAAVSGFGVLGRAVKQRKIAIDVRNPRDFAVDRYRTVDDRPYGGGPGMLMKMEPLEAAIQSASQVAPPGVRTVYFSPQGRAIDQHLFQNASHKAGFVFVCGRYEGVDERFIESYVDEEWSLGDFVLSGGELAAMSAIDGIARLLPGVLGHDQSADQDSYSEGLLDCPHYTRPFEYRGELVPDVLVSGDHERIRRWRLKESLGRTWERRPDLLGKRELSKEEVGLLDEYKEECKVSKKK